MAYSPATTSMFTRSPAIPTTAAIPWAPLAGRIEPQTRHTRGRGLWLANQLCDLIQIRSVPEGTQARAHVVVA